MKYNYENIYDIILKKRWPKMSTSSCPNVEAICNVRRPLDVELKHDVCGTISEH